MEWWKYLSPVLGVPSAAGSLLGATGGAIQGLTGQATPTTTWMRDTGGQLTGGQRIYNQVPETPLMPGASRTYFPQVLGTTTGGDAFDASSIEWLNPNAFSRGDGGGNGGDGSGGDGGMDTYTAQWLAGLENAKRMAGTYRGEAQSLLDNLLDYLGGYRTRVGELGENAAQQIRNIFAGQAGDLARTGAGARQMAINQARAMGLGASSKMGLLNQVTGGLAGGIGSALAKRGEQQRANQAFQRQQEAEADLMERQGRGSYDAAMARAGEIERSGIQNVGFDYQSALNQLQQQAQALAQLRMSGPDIQSLTGYTPQMGNLAQSLNAMQPSVSAMAGSAGVENFANPVNFTNIMDILRKNNPYSHLQA